MAMWDHYFQLADPFFVFYLALVMLVNARWVSQVKVLNVNWFLPSTATHRDQILSMKDDAKATVVDALSMMPCDIAADDTSDFCTLAQYYATKTPSSFRAVSASFTCWNLTIVWPSSKLLMQLIKAPVLTRLKFLNGLLLIAGVDRNVLLHWATHS